MVRREGDGIIDDTGLKPFDPTHLARLRLDIEVAVDHPHAAGLRHGDGHARLGHGVHRGTQKRDIEGDRLGHLRARVGIGRQDRAFARHKENVVKSEGLANLHWRVSLEGVGWHVPIPWGGLRGKDEM